MICDPQYRSVHGFASWLIFMAVECKAIRQISIGYNGATVMTDIGNVHVFVFRDEP